MADEYVPNTQEVLIDPKTEVDRTLIRNWIIDRIKTDEYLMEQYSNENPTFRARVNVLLQTETNQEATDFLISVLEGKERIEL